MARVIKLTFPAANRELLLPTSNGNATSSIILSHPYPFVFPHVARKISFTSPDDLSGSSLEIVGTDEFGNLQEESLVGPNATTLESFFQYNTVSRIGIDQNYTNLSIGSGTSGTFQWILLNSFSFYPPTGLAVEVFGTIDYSIFSTLESIAYYQQMGGTYAYLYPHRLPLGADPIATSNGSGVVTVTIDSTAALNTGDFVTIKNATTTNNITANELNIKAPITVLSPTTFSYQTVGMANATGAGGGNFVVVYYPPLPFSFPILINQTVSTQNQFPPPLGSLQLIVNSSSNSGALIATILQEGIR